MKKVLILAIPVVLLFLAIVIKTYAYNAWSDCRRHSASGNQPARNTASSGAGSFGLVYSTVSAYAEVDQARHDTKSGIHDYVSISVADSGPYHYDGDASASVGGWDENTGVYKIYNSSDWN